MLDLSFGSLWWWVGFNAFVVLMLALDLGVFHRSEHEVSLKEAAAWTSTWITLALLFNVFLFFQIGEARALEFTTGYLIELSLSVDNIFVFLVILRYFSVPRKTQHRVLFWGVLGALFMRAFMIFAGILLLQRFHWLIYVFGGFLIFTGYKMFRHGDEEIHPERNPVLRWLGKIIPIGKKYHGKKFFAMENGKKVATDVIASQREATALDKAKPKTATTETTTKLVAMSLTNDTTGVAAQNPTDHGTAVDQNDEEDGAMDMGTGGYNDNSA